MEFRDYYKVMGVERDATQDEIKRAYRKLARKYHPDVSKESDAEQRFKEVGEAYAVLKDPEKRTAYDQLGADWKKGQDFRPPPNWDQGFEFHGGDSTGGGAEEFSDFFETLFGRGDFRGGFTRADHRPFTARGEDTYAKVVVDLQDSYLGATRSVTLKHTEIGADGRPAVRNRTLSVKIPKVCGLASTFAWPNRDRRAPAVEKAATCFWKLRFDRTRISMSKARTFT